MMYSFIFLLSVSSCQWWKTVHSFSDHWPHHRRIQNPPHCHIFRSDVLLHAYTIRTNLESIAEERYQQPVYRKVEWMDPTKSSNNINDDDDDDSMILPIYPIPAVYLPIGNHTLNNVEPRNLKMALDLNATSDDTSSSPLFCVTLMAADTGKIATTGTLLRAVEIEPTYDPVEPDRLTRIRVYCQAEGIVEIDGIENPEAASPQQRLLRSSEYLRGRVRIKDQENDVSKSEVQEWKDQLSTDYRLIKTMYELKVWDEMPPNAMTNLAKALPDNAWPEEDGDVWQAAQIWQSLCLTIQSGRQQLLNSDRNELMVEAISKNGGPLKLPIHVEDLEISDRRRVQELEIQAERDFLQLQLDPNLDFLALLSLDSLKDKLQWLGEMVSRERRRMEQAALEYSSGPIDEDDDDEELQKKPVQKGAWFNDDLW